MRTNLHTQLSIAPLIRYTFSLTQSSQLLYQNSLQTHSSLDTLSTHLTFSTTTLLHSPLSPLLPLLLHSLPTLLPSPTPAPHPPKLIPLPDGGTVLYFLHYVPLSPANPGAKPILELVEYHLHMKRQQGDTPGKESTQTHEQPITEKTLLPLTSHTLLPSHAHTPSHTLLQEPTTSFSPPLPPPSSPPSPTTRSTWRASATSSPPPLPLR